jgi:hypothetical protein
VADTAHARAAIAAWQTRVVSCHNERKEEVEEEDGVLVRKEAL